MSTETILDWRPFDYATTESLNHGKRTMSETTILTALPDGGTRLQENMVFYMPLPAWIRRPLVRFMMTKKYKYDELLRLAARMAGEQMSAEGIDNETHPE